MELREHMELTKSQLEALPRPPRPANVYELLDRVCEAILAEPKRYWQEEWLKRTSPHFDSINPTCGTVACRAGWICVIERTTRRHSFTLDSKVGVSDDELVNLDDDLLLLRMQRHDSIPHRAKGLLGVWEADAPEDLGYDVNALFHGNALHVERGDTTDEEGSWEQELPEEGTQEYAELGVKGIRAFMAKYEDWLKSRPLPEVE